jgi:hypothetical protein
MALLMSPIHRRLAEVNDDGDGTMGDKVNDDGNGATGDNVKDDGKGVIYGVINNNCDGTKYNDNDDGNERQHR